MDVKPQEPGTNLTLGELLLWNQDQLAKLVAVGEHVLPQLESLRLNAIEVAKERCARNAAAIEQNTAEFKVRPWMMETFGTPQMVRVLDPNGNVMGVVEVLQILQAKPSEQLH